MIRFLFIILFMIPLVNFIRGFWLHQVGYFIIMFFILCSYSYNFIFNSIRYFIGKDIIRYILILLRVWICCLIITARLKVEFTKVFPKLFLFTILMLLLSLYMAFSSVNLFVFYIFFEMSLIPTLILILGWGYQPERLQAGVYLLFYTFFGSLPIIISIFYLYLKRGTLDYYFFPVINSLRFFVCINFAFLVKIPMYFLHLWLPKAHVEAPVSGSMILAGVILKLGGYGIIRLLMVSLPIVLKVRTAFVSISLIGGFIVSLVCLCQPDIKSLIAYSSVSHIGLVLAGLITLSYWGLLGALIIIIAHGLCSSGLFCLSNLRYERLSRRRLFINKGLINLIPRISLWWFLLCSSNMAAPPSLNLLGEITLINTLVAYRALTIPFLILISFFRAGYSLYLYSYTQHGKMFTGTYSFYLGNVREHLLLFLHWFPLNILVLVGWGFICYYLSSLKVKR